LRKLGYTVTTGVATTGVVGVLEGGLPVKSTAKAQWAGQEVGVMHACGHDNHMAILLGTATALERMKDRLPGRPRHRASRLRCRPTSWT